MEFCAVQAQAGGEPLDANECRDGKENLGKDQRKEGEQARQKKLRLDSGGV